MFQLLRDRWLVRRIGQSMQKLPWAWPWESGGYRLRSRTKSLNIESQCGLRRYGVTHSSLLFVSLSLTLTCSISTLLNIPSINLILIDHPIKLGAWLIKGLSPCLVKEYLFSPWPKTKLKDLINLIKDLINLFKDLTFKPQQVSKRYFDSKCINAQTKPQAYLLFV